MRGDVILVEDHHRAAARAIVDQLEPRIRRADRRYTLTVAGESGAGKSETATAIADSLRERGLATGIYQQDDYFVLPPRSNDARRRQGIDWVGPEEVRLDLLDAHLAAARVGASSVTKPLVIYAEDRVIEEEMSLEGLRVLIAEGTYTTLLQNADCRIFIARTRLDTLADRKRRAREAPDPFIEQVLELEHAVIAAHRTLADLVITRDYEVEPGV